MESELTCLNSHRCYSLHLVVSQYELAYIPCAGCDYYRLLDH